MNFLDRLNRPVIFAPAILVAGLTAACAPMHTPPQEVSNSEPTVTYKYQSDQDLIEVDRRAAGYCSKYNLLPSPSNFRTDPDGQRVVTYRCLPSTAAAPNPAPPAPANPRLTYSYRTDRELLTASQNARVYCQSSGMHSSMVNTVVNTDGSKTAEFRCVP